MRRREREGIVPAEEGAPTKYPQLVGPLAPLALSARATAQTQGTTPLRAPWPSRGLGRLECQVAATSGGRTRHVPLDGARGGPWEEFARSETAFLCGRHRLGEGPVRHLVSRYGRRARDVAAYLERDPALARPALAGEPDLLAEFAYQHDHEMALFPADHLLRRTRLGLFHPEAQQARQPARGAPG